MAKSRRRVFLRSDRVKWALSPTRTELIHVTTSKEPASHDHREHRKIAKRRCKSTTSTSSPISSTLAPLQPLQLAEMTVAEAVKSAVGLGETSGMIPGLIEAIFNPRNLRVMKLTTFSSHSPGDVRGSPPHAVPRFMRPPSHSPQPLPASRILPSLEVRGMEIFPMDRTIEHNWPTRPSWFTRRLTFSFL
jgi:hypothetical protein